MNIDRIVNKILLFFIVITGLVKLVNAHKRFGHETPPERHAPYPLKNESF